MWDLLNTSLISGILLLILGGLGFFLRPWVLNIIGRRESNKKWSYFEEKYPNLHQMMKINFNDPVYSQIDELVITKKKITFNSSSPRFYYDGSTIEMAWEGMLYLDELGYLDLIKRDDLFRIYQIKNILRTKLKN